MLTLSDLQARFENIVAKGDVVHNEQYLFFATMFSTLFINKKSHLFGFFTFLSGSCQELSAADMLWERVYLHHSIIC